MTLDDAFKNVEENFKNLVKEETDKVIYNTVKNIINKEQPSFSQCPGECYSEFWENADGDNEPTINIDKLTEGLHWNGKKWVEQTTQYRIDYYKEGDLSRRWKYCKTIHSAISRSYEMIQTGNYTIIGIEAEYDLTPA